MKIDSCITGLDSDEVIFNFCTMRPQLNGINAAHNEAAKQ